VIWPPDFPKETSSFSGRNSSRRSVISAEEAPLGQW
jgi:hypothetical protein